jgi:hypothetical protein
MTDLTYWAAGDAKKLVEKLDADRRVWVDQSVSSGVFAGYIGAYWRNTIAYYSAMLAPKDWESSLEFAGKVGELIKMKVPRAHTLLNQFVTIVTKQRLNYETLTDVTDAEPQTTAKLGTNICKTVSENNNLDNKIEELGFLAGLVGLSFLVTTWREDLGREYSADEEKIQYAGEPQINVCDLADVMWDWTIKDWKNVPYCVVKMKRNRWDLIAQNPQYTEIIRGLPSAEAEARQWNNLTYVSGTQNDDMVWQYYFYHRPSPALPDGRMVRYLTPESVISDTPNPFLALPVEPVVFTKVKDTSLGYPMFSNLLPCQEMLDHCFSTQASNQSVFGLQALANPRGNKVSVEDINGLRMFNYTPQSAEGGGKPEPMTFPDTPVSVMNFATVLQNAQSEMSMLNDTLRGQPPPNVTSGTMAATLSANALEFMNSAQKAIITAVERTMNHVIMAYKNLATVDQIVDITGESSFSYVKQFKAESLSGLRKIKIRTQSAMMNSQAGRIALGETLTSQGMADPGKLVQLYEGAPIETLFEGKWTQEIAVQAEIDRLMEGGEAFPLETDNHPLYIAAYGKVLDNPIIRERTQIPSIIVPLMKQRMAMEMEMDSTPQGQALKAMLRGQPLPQMAPPPPQVGGKSPQKQPELVDQVGKVAQPSEPAEPMPMQ